MLSPTVPQENSSGDRNKDLTNCHLTAIYHYCLALQCKNSNFHCLNFNLLWAVYIRFQVLYIGNLRDAIDI